MMRPAASRYERPRIAANGASELTVPPRPMAVAWMARANSTMVHLALTARHKIDFWAGQRLLRHNVRVWSAHNGCRPVCARQGSGGPCLANQWCGRRDANDIIRFASEACFKRFGFDCTIEYLDLAEACVHQRAGQITEAVMDVCAGIPDWCFWRDEKNLHTVHYGGGRTAGSDNVPCDDRQMSLVTIVQAASPVVESPHQA